MTARTHVALLRGINVGGNNKVKMTDLAAALEELGFTNVKTILQSGNVAFSSTRAPSEEELKKEIAARLELKVECFVRTKAEWARLVSNNPFVEQAAKDPAHLLVIFLRYEPAAESVRTVQAAVKGPEQLQASGNHLFAMFPVDIGHSKLFTTPGYAKLAGAGTARNWKTILKLQALLE